MAESDLQTEGDALLARWGRYARRVSDVLGYPRTSCIAQMMEHIKAETRKERRNQKPEASWTAKGKQNVSRKPVNSQVLPYEYMAIDRIVAQSPNQMKKVLQRAYLWGQPDRIAARELRIERELFTQQREAAVEWVMRKFTVNY